MTEQPPLMKFEWELDEAIAHLRRRFEDWCDIPVAVGMSDAAIEAIPGYRFGPRVNAYALRAVLQAVEDKR